MLHVQGTGRTDEAELLGLSAAAQLQRINRSQDVSRLESRVRVHPVNERSVVNHGIQTVGEVFPQRLRKAELRFAKVTTDTLQSASPGTVPEAVGAAGGVDTFQGLVFGLSADKGHNTSLGGLASKEIAEDVCTQETSSTVKEDGWFAGEDRLGTFRE